MINRELNQFITYVAVACTLAVAVCAAEGAALCDGFGVTRRQINPTESTCAYAGEVECARVPGEAVAVGGAVASSAARAEALVVARRVVGTAHAQAVVVARERIDGEGCSQGHEGDSGTEEPRAGEHGLCKEEWHNTKR